MNYHNQNGYGNNQNRGHANQRRNQQSRGNHNGFAALDEGSNGTGAWTRGAPVANNTAAIPQAEHRAIWAPANDTPRDQHAARVTTTTNSTYGSGYSNNNSHKPPAGNPTSNFSRTSHEVRNPNPNPTNNNSNSSNLKSYGKRDTYVPSIWQSHPTTKSKLVQFNNTKASLRMPIENKCVSIDSLTRDISADEVERLVSEFRLNSAFPKSLTTSAIIALDLNVDKMKDNNRVNIKHNIYFSMDEIRYLLENSEFCRRNREMTDIFRSSLEADQQRWYKPTICRFAGQSFKEQTDRPYQRLIAHGMNIHKKSGLVFREDGIMGKRVMDYNYSSTYLYYYTAHYEWNQLFLPEPVVMLGSTQVMGHRLVLHISDRAYYHLSSTRKLYLYVENMEKFIDGHSQVLSVTPNEVHATVFSIFGAVSGLPLDADAITNDGRYELNIGSYPIYTGKSSIFFDKCHDIDSFMRNSIDDCNKLAKIPSVNIDDERLAKYLSGEQEGILYHPSKPVIGLFGMSLCEALTFAYQLCAHLRPHGSGKFYMEACFRYDQALNDEPTIGIGCRAVGDLTTAQNVTYYLDSAARETWNKVVLQVAMDDETYLRLLRTPSAKFSWVKRVYCSSFSPELLLDNAYYQRILQGDILDDVKRIMESNESLRNGSVLEMLHHTEENLLHLRSAKTFADLQVKQKSFLDFLLDQGPELTELLECEKQSPIRERVEELGVRLLSRMSATAAVVSMTNIEAVVSGDAAQEQEYDGSIQRAVSDRVLAYFGVKSASELGYANAERMFKSIVVRSKTSELAVNSARYLWVPPLHAHNDLQQNSIEDGLDEADGLQALCDCNVLDDLYTASKWRVVFEDSLGPLHAFLASHANEIAYVEVAHNHFLKLPDMENEYDSRRDYYLRSLEQFEVDVPSVHSTVDADSDHNAIDIRQCRRLVGLIIGATLSQDRESEVARNIQRIFGGYWQATSSMVLLVQLVATCLHICPQEVLCYFGQLLLPNALSEKLVREVGDDIRSLRVPVGSRVALTRIARQLSRYDIVSLLSNEPRAVDGVFKSDASRTCPLADVTVPEFDTAKPNYHIHDEDQDASYLIRRQEEAGNLCAQLASDLMLELAPSHDKYIGKVGGEKLRQTTKKAIMVIAQQLYSHQGRSIYELIQNADDCTYDSRVTPRLQIELVSSDASGSSIEASSNGKVLTLVYNETGFTPDNLLAISDVNASTKVLSSDQGGKKGIGFKSVFMVSSRPEVHSKGYHFGFNESGELGYISPIPLSPPERGSRLAMLSQRETVIQLPIRRHMPQTSGSALLQSSSSSCVDGVQSDSVQESVYQLLRERLGRLGGDVLLFLRRIREIQVNVENSNTTGHFRSDAAYLRRIVSTSPVGTNVDLWVVADESETMFRDKFAVPSRPVQVAIPLHHRKSCDLYALLPVRSYSLPFAVNGPFEVTANREDIYDPRHCEVNQRIIDRIPTVFVEAVKHTISYAKAESDRLRFDDAADGRFVEVIEHACRSVVNAIPTPSSVSFQFSECAGDIAMKLRTVEFLPAILPSAEDGAFSPMSPSAFHSLGVLAGGVFLVAPKNAVVLRPEWRGIFDDNRLAIALCAPGQIPLYLVDPKFNIGSDTCRALDIKMLSADMLVECLQNLWEKRVIRGNLRGSGYYARVFQELWGNLLAVVPSSRQNEVSKKLRANVRVPVLSAGDSRPLVALDQASVLYVPNWHLSWLERNGLMEVFFDFVLSYMPSTHIVDPTVSRLLNEDIFAQTTFTSLIADSTFFEGAIDSYRQLSASSMQQLVRLLAAIKPQLGKVQNQDDEWEQERVWCSKNLARLSLIVSDHRRNTIMEEVIEEHWRSEMLLWQSIHPASSATIPEEDIYCLYQWIVEHRPSAVVPLDDEATLESHHNDAIIRRFNQSDNTDSARLCEIGKSGEMFAFRMLFKQYGASYDVEWLNASGETFKPYDIRISDRVSGEIIALVEVKTTTGRREEVNSHIFEISINECAKMAEFNDKYWVARVYWTDQVCELEKQPFERLNRKVWKLLCQLPTSEVDAISST